MSGANALNQGDVTERSPFVLEDSAAQLNSSRKSSSWKTIVLAGLSIFSAVVLVAIVFFLLNERSSQAIHKEEVKLESSFDAIKIDFERRISEAERSIVLIESLQRRIHILETSNCNCNNSSHGNVDVSALNNLRLNLDQRMNTLEQKNEMNSKSMARRVTQLEAFQSEVISHGLIGNKTERENTSEETTVTSLPGISDLDDHYTTKQGHSFNAEEVIKELQKEIMNIKTKALLTAKVPRTCLEYASFGVTKSDWYQIDPDGHGIGEAPITVYCDFENGGTTEISHDTETTMNVSSCNENSCFAHNVSYGANLRQVSVLMSLSDECEQDFHFDCFMSGLKGFGSLVMGDGSRRTQFDQEFDCGCKRNDSCRFSPVAASCNCDAAPQPRTWLSDWGAITNKSVLPIAAFNYGHLLGGEHQAAFRMGRLKCKGWVRLSEGKERACARLKLAGQWQSGYHMADDKSLVYCNMSQPVASENIQRHIGSPIYAENVKQTEKRVFFYGTTTSLFSYALSPTSYNKVADSHNAFQQHSGRFQAPKGSVQLLSFANLFDQLSSILKSFRLHS